MFKLCYGDNWQLSNEKERKEKVKFILRKYKKISVVPEPLINEK